MAIDPVCGMTVERDKSAVHMQYHGADWYFCLKGCHDKFRAERLSRATMRNIRQNLFFVFLYNTAGVPIASGVLYPLFGILLSPMIAAASMSFSSISVISNALHLRRIPL